MCTFRHQLWMEKHGFAATYIWWNRKRIVDLRSFYFIITCRCCFGYVSVIISMYLLFIEMLYGSRGCMFLGCHCVHCATQKMVKRVATHHLTWFLCKSSQVSKTKNSKPIFCYARQSVVIVVRHTAHTHSHSQRQHTILRCNKNKHFLRLLHIQQ